MDKNFEKLLKSKPSLFYGSIRQQVILGLRKVAKLMKQANKYIAKDTGYPFRKNTSTTKWYRGLSEAQKEGQMIRGFDLNPEMHL